MTSYTMRTLSVLLLVVFPVLATSFDFPGPDDDPLVAVLDFRNKMVIFNPALGGDASVIEKIHLQGPRGGAAISIDFNYREKVVYWGNVFNNRVNRLKVGGDTQEQSTINEDYYFGSPEGLAYDWIHDNLYVADWGNGGIVVVNHTTAARKTIINLPKTRDVEVDPKLGWLYYIAGWEETAALYASSLNGENQRILSSNLDRPKSLVLDYDEQRLYWAEAYKVNRIYSIKTNGDDQKIFYQGGPTFDTTPNYITISGEYVIFNQVYDSYVFGRKKHNATETIRYRNLESYGRYNIQENLYIGMVSIDPRRQKESVNQCGSNKGGCSHFCLPSVVGLTPAFTCVCPDDQVLMPDNKTCSNPVAELEATILI